MSEYKIWVEDIEQSTEYEIAIARAESREPHEHMYAIAKALQEAAREFNRQGFLAYLESEST